MIPVCARSLALAAALLLVPGGTVRSGEPATGGRFVERQIRLDGEVHRYAVWLPPDFEAHRTWPALVFLHGSGECGRDGEKPTKVGLGPVLIEHRERWPFVVLFPQKPREDEEWEEHEGLVYAILERSIRDLAIDRRRVALVGMSQGGHGAWMIGARHPERWRALVPVCGYGRARTISGRVARLSVWAFHGLQDDLVSPGDTRAIIAGIREARERLGLDPGEARMTLFPEANHNSWDPAFAHDSLGVWLRVRLGAE